MLTTRWNNVEIKLYQRCFNVVSTSDTYVVSKLWNVENPTSDFLSFSTSDFVSFSLIHNVETTLIRRWNVGWVVICNKIKKVPEKRTLKTEGEEGDWIKFFFLEDVNGQPLKRSFNTDVAENSHFRELRLDIPNTVVN